MEYYKVVCFVFCKKVMMIILLQLENFTVIPNQLYLSKNY